MVTVSGLEEGRSLAVSLVDARLAACVNMIDGVRSIYRWQGAVEEDAEVKLMIKTTARCVPALVEEVNRLHSYEGCEVTVVPIIDGNEPYLAWVRQNTRD